MGYTAAVAAVIGVGVSYNAAEESKRAGERQFTFQTKQKKEQKKLANIKAARERRKQAREVRIAQAQIAVSAGGVESSKSAGAGGSVLTQAASAGGFAGQQQQGAQSIFEQGLLASQASADIASAQAQGQIGGSISGLSSVASNPSVQSIFK